MLRHFRLGSLVGRSKFPDGSPKKKPHQGVLSIKQVLISLRDPNGVAVRPSGFDCVRPCHSERSGAESNCEAAPSKAKVESRADSAQDDTQGATPSEKITKGVRAILFVLLFTRLAPQGIVCYTFLMYCRAVMSLPCVNGRKFASKLAQLAVTEGL